eukprot:CAMPEP_0172485432 /NCGR_PEP_ID=MMETSP1066-20121228/13486_1 /TAXON_ID=671091 /ORGANISM="Coscinodiscus wailesii, Strain CCMP2513" /LENGTH=128 /DNA_ID=CAMNT_0013250713 /DNA_START=234 /DNA_END=620 /DNA_ORIENTATION=-
MKKAGQSIVDTGAKTMLKTDVVFLEREIKSRKQNFGVEVYDLMASLEKDKQTSIEEKEGKIRLAFDAARKDIAVIRAKIDCKKEEMDEISRKDNNYSVATAVGGVGGGSHAMGTNHVIVQGHPDDLDH